jgi:site-specific DNA-methyltransferase (adenine-specific)
MDGGTQPRATLDEATIAAYVRDMENGDEFPPVEVYYDGTNHWLVDGFHRLAATKRLKRLHLTATVRQGSLDDAQWFSYGVNQRHGLRRTNDDKRRAVEAALRHPYAGQYSNVQIAQHCGVDEGTIRKYREKLSSEIPKIANTSERTVTRNGTTYTQNTANIGKRTGPSPALSGSNGADSDPTPEQVSTSLPSGVGEQALDVALTNPLDQATGEEMGASVPVSAPDHAGSGRSDIPALANLPDQADETIVIGASVLVSPPDQTRREGTGASVLVSPPDQTRREGTGAPALANHPEQPGERVVIGEPALAISPDQAEERTVAFPCTINGVTIHQGDCCAVLAEMAPETVDLIVTSPPYNLGIAYDQYDDNRDDYDAFTQCWLSACHRVLKPDGRLCLNVPLDTHHDPTFGYRLFIHSQSTGFHLKTTIIWNEQNISKGTAWGSWQSASAPHIIAPIELILVLYKGQWEKLRKGTSTITSDEFKIWAGAGGVWTFPGERRNGHPAAFPPELPRRCLKLFSYVDDLVLDPFAGSGTTGVAAVELGRPCVLIEQSETYCQEAVWRLQ